MRFNKACRPKICDPLDRIRTLNSAILLNALEVGSYVVEVAHGGCERVKPPLARSLLPASLV